MVEEHHISGADLDNVKYVPHVIGVNIHESSANFDAQEKRRKRVYTSTLCGARSCFCHPDGADLEVHPDRVELLEQRGISDPALLHIVMVLREGLQDRRADDAMYGEALSTALAVYILLK